RGYLLLSLPLGTLLLLTTRFVWRKWLVRRRAAGSYSARTLLVGTTTSVANMARELQRAKSAGFTPVGACVPRSALTDAAGTATVQGTSVPVVGTIDDVVTAMQKVHADTAVLASAEELPAAQVKRISWALEAGRQHLVLAPGIMDVAGPRMHI